MSESKPRNDHIRVDKYEMLSEEETSLIKRVFEMAKREGPKGEHLLRKDLEANDEALPQHYSFGLSTYCDDQNIVKLLLARRQNPFSQQDE